MEEPPFFYIVFYSNLDFMLKEILQIKTLIEDASKAMTLTYAVYNKMLSFDFNRIGTDDLGNGVFIIFPKHDWPLTYIIKDTNGLIHSTHNDHNVNGIFIDPWIYNLSVNDFLTCSVKSKYGHDIKPNEYPLVDTNHPEYSINNMKNANYGKHYLDNAKTVADIMPYLLKEMPILRLDDSYLDPKDKSIIDRNKVMNSFIYRNQIAHCFYKRVTKRCGNKPITGQNIIDCIMELANYRCKDILASQKVQRKQLAKNKLNKISYMADIQNLFTSIKTKNEWTVTASKNNNNLQHYLAKLANDKPNAYNYSIHIIINPKKNKFKVSSPFLKRTQNLKDKDSAYNFITCLTNLLDITSMND